MSSGSNRSARRESAQNAMNAPPLPLPAMSSPSGPPGGCPPGSTVPPVTRKPRLVRHARALAITVSSLLGTTGTGSVLRGAHALSFASSLALGYERSDRRPRHLNRRPSLNTNSQYVRSGPPPLCSPRTARGRNFGGRFTSTSRTGRSRRRGLGGATAPYGAERDGARREHGDHAAREVRAD